MQIDGLLFSLKEIEPNHSRKNLIGFTILLSLILAGGLFILLIFLIDPNHKAAMLPPGIFMTILGILYFYSIFFNMKKVKYFIDKNQIILKNGKKEIELKYNELESIIEVGEKDAEEQMKNLSDKSHLEQKQMALNALETFNFQKIKDAFKLQANSMHPYKFLSVRMIQGQTKKAGRASKSFVNLPCDCVLIKLKDGNFYYISPLDCHGFVNETRRYLRR